MKSHWFGAAVVAAVAQLTAAGAFAADLSPAPVYTKAPPVAAPYSWTGCYVGVNGGYGWNNGSSSYQDSNSTADPINFIPSTPAVAYVPSPTSTGSSGWLGGGGAGCNWQSQQWVFGVEGDIDGGHISGSNTTSAFSPREVALGPNVFTGIDTTTTANEQVSLRWLSTIRARAGIAVQDRVLLYATGGLAVGGVNSQGSVNTTTTGGFSSVVWNGSNSTVKAGYVVGGGVEWAFYDRWTAKAEYLWYNLGNVSHPLNCTSDGGAPCFNDVYPTLGSTSSSVFGSIVRVGVNYKFGGP
jgi:outer membrane immunogenic protein